jgi:hypothetical protein
MMAFRSYAAKFSSMCPSSSIPNRRRRFNKWVCFRPHVKNLDGTYRFVSDKKTHSQPLDQHFQERVSRKIFKDSVRNYEINA